MKYLIDLAELHGKIKHSPHGVCTDELLLAIAERLEALVEEVRNLRTPPVIVNSGTEIRPQTWLPDNYRIVPDC